MLLFVYCVDMLTVSQLCLIYDYYDLRAMITGPIQNVNVLTLY